VRRPVLTAISCNQNTGKKNILFLTSSFPKTPESPEGNFIHDLILHLSAHDFKSFTLTPHFPDAPIKESWSSVQVFRFPYFFPTRFENLAYGAGILFNLRKNPLLIISIPPFFLSELLFSIYLIKKYKISLIHSHWFLPQGLIGSILHYFLKIPHIATIHGSDLNMIKNHPVLHPVCRFIVRNADTVTVNSTFMQQQLVDVAPSSAVKIRVIPMGVDPERLKVRAQDNVAEPLRSRQIILSVGRLIDWKGTISLINAMPAVLKNFPDAMLVIIGTGPEEANLKKRVQELGLNNDVRFMGFVKSEDLPSYYHQACVFVLPSLNINGRTEGLGVVLLEAMTAGCPVIGSNVGGIPDIIIDGETGFLVPERDPAALALKICQVLSDADLRDKFRRNGYERIRNFFTWEKISEMFSCEYHQAIEKNCPEPK
jgi:glycosyltransferase involved in cell wall biosynthesis